MTFHECAVCGERDVIWALVAFTDADGVVRHKHTDVDEFGDDVVCVPRSSGASATEGFDQPEDGSQARYDKRVAERPWLAHTFWWCVHNAVAHPLIAFFPHTRLFRFHDWTSRKMHGR